jgi:hypothetical protein
MKFRFLLLFNSLEMNLLILPSQQKVKTTYAKLKSSLAANSTCINAINFCIP